MYFFPNFFFLNGSHLFWFFFHVKLKKICYWNYFSGPSNRPRQQIKPNPTSWQYPLINYLCSHQDHRHCSFNNLCYSPHLDRYIFFHSGNKSVISGLDDPSEQFNLVRLSTLTGNNEFYLNYISMPQSSSDRFDIEFVESPGEFI